MNTKERIRLCTLLTEMKNNEIMAKKSGLKDASKIKIENEKKEVKKI